MLEQMDLVLAHGLSSRRISADSNCPLPWLICIVHAVARSKEFPRPIPIPFAYSISVGKPPWLLRHPPHDALVMEFLQKIGPVLYTFC
jgi:hypothetical protein